MRDIQRAVAPDSVNAAIARTGKWLALYMTVMAIASSTR